MELPIDLFNHLCSPQLQLLKDNPSQKHLLDKGKVLLDKQQQLQMESGFIVAQYLIKLLQMKIMQNINMNMLGSLKSSHNPTSKLFNWNTIMKEVEKIGIKMDSDQKSLMVAGDPQVIIELVKLIYEQEKNTALSQISSRAQSHRKISSQSQKQRLNDLEEPLDILAINIKKQLIETETSLEFIIVSLSQALNIQAKQSAGLLANHNHYLLHACVKGVKSNYEPIINWYQSIYASSKHLNNLTLNALQIRLQKDISQQQHLQPLFMLLNTLKCGFYSENIVVVEWTCKLFTRIAQDFDNSNMLTFFYQWFVLMPNTQNEQLGGGFEATLYALNKHSQIAETVALHLVTTFKGQFEQIISELKLNHFKKNLASLLQLINELLPYFQQQDKEQTVQDLLQKSGIIEECVNIGLDEQLDTQLRAQSLSLITEIWSLEPYLIQENTSKVENDCSLIESILKIFKKSCKDSNISLRISALGLAFRLLDIFAQKRNPQAPVIYKMLTFSMIQNIQEDVTREFMMTSFSEIYQNHISIPVNILIEPLLRYLQTNEDSYSFNIFDFDFFSHISKHQKLTSTPWGLQLMDQFAKIILNIQIWSQCAQIPFIILADRFNSDPNIQDFLIKFTSIALSQLLQITKQPEIKTNKPLQGKFKKQAKAQTNKDEEITNKIKRYNIITIIRKIISLQISEEFNEELKDLILASNKKYKELYGDYNKGLLSLLEEWYDNATQINDLYIKDIEQSERKNTKENKKKTSKKVDKQEITKRNGFVEQFETNRSVVITDQQNNSFEQMQDGHSEIQSTQRSPRRDSYKRKEEGQIVLYKEPKNNIEQKAFIQLQTIKQKREEKLQKQKQEEEQKRQKAERKIREAQEEIKKRKIKLGVNTKIDDSIQNQLVLYQEPIQEETPKNQNQIRNKDTEQIKLIDLENDEEERDRDGVKILQQKYQKLFKFLFNKYAMSRAQHKKIEKFEYFGDKTINLAEINKLLRDHDITQQMINKEQLQSLIRLINMKFVKRQDLSALDFNSYMFLMVQLAYLIYTKDFSYLSPQEMLMKLISHFEKATRSRGQSTLLYEDPDISTIGDQEMLKEMNKRIRENPDYILPEGFYKVYEKEQVFYYQLPDYLGLPESQKNVIEVLDELIYNGLGVHFLEPLVTYEQRIKVKPRIKHANQIPAPNGALQYMKPIERKQFTSGIDAVKKQQISETEQYKKPNLGVDLKLAVYQLQKDYPNQQRHLIQETAEVLEEILFAVENGMNQLPQREKIKYTKDVWNKAKEDKQLKELQERQIEKEREEKRKQRSQKLQQDLEKQKELKQSQIEEQQKLREQQEKQNKERELKEKEERKKKMEERKQLTEEQKKLKLEELEKRKQEEEERKLKEKIEKQKDQKEFLQKQKEKLEYEFQQRKKEKEEAEKAKQDLEEWKKQKQAKVKNKMENYIKQNKDQFKNEEKERQDIINFMQEPDVQEVFTKYDKALEYMFKFYASQDKKEISFNLGQILQMMNFKGFIKFGFQTNITPSVIPNDDMVLIFRALVRERQDNLTQKEIDEHGSAVTTLGYEDFKKAIVRISILGQELLGGHGGQRLEAKLIEQLNAQDSSNAKPPKTLKSRGRSTIHSQNSSRRNLLQKQSIQPESSAARMQSQTRKTKEQKILDELNKEKERQEKMLSVKIEDKRMSKPFDVSLITAQSIEGLLKFIQLSPDDDNYKLDRKLNKQRIEVQGQKPNKFKKEKALEIANQKNDNKENQDIQEQGITQNEIQAVELDELEQQENINDTFISPSGEKEKWQIFNEQ